MIYPAPQFVDTSLDISKIRTVAPISQWHKFHLKLRYPHRVTIWLYLVSFLRYSMSKMLWPWNRGQRSLKVIESGIIRHVYHFLLVFFIVTLSLKRTVFSDIMRLQKCRDVENRVISNDLDGPIGSIRLGHWKYHRSIERIRLPIDVL